MVMEEFTKQLVISNAAIVASNDAVIRSNSLLSESNDRISKLAAYGRRSRHILWFTVFSLCVDLMLTGGLAIALQRSNGAKAARALAIKNCHATNTFRGEAAHLWTESLLLPPTASAAAKARADLLLSIIKQTYGPTVCAR